MEQTSHVVWLSSFVKHWALNLPQRAVLEYRKSHFRLPKLLGILRNSPATVQLAFFSYKDAVEPLRVDCALLLVSVGVLHDLRVKGAKPPLLMLTSGAHEACERAKHRRDAWLRE